MSSIQQISTTPEFRPAALLLNFENEAIGAEQCVFQIKEATETRAKVNLVTLIVLATVTIASAGLGLYAWSLLATTPLLIASIAFGIITYITGTVNYSYFSSLSSRSIELCDSLTTLARDMGVGQPAEFNRLTRGSLQNQFAASNDPEQLEAFMLRAVQIRQEIDTLLHSAEYDFLIGCKES